MSDDLVLDPLAARLALEAAVDQLTQRGKVDRGDGAGQGETLSLLATIEDAVATNDGAGSARAGGSRSPGRLAAIAVLVELDEVVGRRGAGSRAQRVRAWSAAMHSADSERLAWAAATAEGWVDRARGFTEPQHRLPVRGETCPACGATRVLTAGGEGEDVIAPAIMVDLRSGEVFCLAAGCESRWRLEQYQQLAANTARQTEHEHLGGWGAVSGPCPDRGHSRPFPLRTGAHLDEDTRTCPRTSPASRAPRETRRRPRTCPRSRA